MMRLRTSRSATGSVVRSKTRPERGCRRASAGSARRPGCASIQPSTRSVPAPSESRVAQHLGGELAVQAEQVVAQRGAGQRAPAVVARRARRCGRAASAAGAGSPSRKCTAATSSTSSSLASADLDDVERREHRRQRRPRAWRGLPARRPRSQLVGRAAPAARRPTAPSSRGERRRTAPSRPARRARRSRDVERPRAGCAAASASPRSTSRRPSSSSRRSASSAATVLSSASISPHSGRISKTSRAHGVGARDVRRGRAGLLVQAEHERRAAAVDHVVGHLRGDDLAAQPVARASASPKRSGSGAGK